MHPITTLQNGKPCLLCLQTPSPALLAVDLGLHSGLALYSHHGVLLWYRSTNFGSYTRLRKGAALVLRQECKEAVATRVTELVYEGARDLAEIWQQAARPYAIQNCWVSPERWRKTMFYQKQIRTGVEAKKNAITFAKILINRSGLPAAHSLGHDAAEAICIGHWRSQQLQLNTVGLP